MPRILLAISICFCLFSSVEAKDSKEYTFMYDVIEAANYCQWTLEYEPTDNDTPVDAMSKSMTRNSKFKMAQNTLQKYVNDKDEVISQVSDVLILGIQVLINANNSRIELLRGLSNMDEKALEDLTFKVATLQSANKEGWEAVATGLGYTLYSYIHFAKSDNPTGPIPFKISKSERTKLIGQLDKYFGDRLKRYYNYREIVAKGGKGNPNDQTWLIVSIDMMRKKLVSETYEDTDKIK